MEARRLYQIIGTLSLKDYKAIVQGNLIKNCLVTLDDIKVAERIFGKDISSIKGKTTRHTPKPVVTDIIEVPKGIIKNNKEVVLCVDIIWVQGLPFLATISIDIGFRTVQFLNNTKEKIVMEAINNVFQVYNKGNFKIKEIQADPKFIKISNNILDDLDIQFNPTPAQ